MQRPNSWLEMRVLCLKTWWDRVTWLLWVMFCLTNVSLFLHIHTQACLSLIFVTFFFFCLPNDVSDSLPPARCAAPAGPPSWLETMCTTTGLWTTPLVATAGSPAWQQRMETKGFATYVKKQGYKTFFAGKYLNQVCFQAEQLLSTNQHWGPGHTYVILHQLFSWAAVLGNWNWLFSEDCLEKKVWLMW